MNKNKNNKNTSFSDQDMLTDMLASEKLLTSVYSIAANESATPKVRSDFVSILTDTHQIQSEIFSEMQGRGWYPVEAADMNKINEAKQKFTQQGM